MSWNSSFSNTTLPGVVATLRPTSNTLSVGLRDMPLPDVLQQVLQALGDALAAAFQRLALRLRFSAR
jgi:hypothetical protein